MQAAKTLSSRPSCLLRGRWLAAFAALAIAATAPGCNSEESQQGTGSSGKSSGEGGSGGGGVGGAGADGVGGGMGAAGGGEYVPACEATVPRPSAPEVLVGPTGLRQFLISLFDQAQSEIQVMMYELDCSSCVSALVAAAQRGVEVRVLLDPTRYSNDDAAATLTAGGVQVKDTPAEFTYSHSKVINIDDAMSVVMSANMNGYSFASERNYGVLDRDPQDIANLKSLFERDWTGSGPVDTSCTRLIISPENSRERILQLIASAQEKLDLAIMYLSDDEVAFAVKNKIADGVQVRMLLAFPEWIDENAATATEFQMAGAQVKFLYTYELHAKLLIADGVAFVGSENLSYNSLENNREVGVLVTEEAPAAQIVAQFEEDWGDGKNP